MTPNGNYASRCHSQNKEPSLVIYRKWESARGARRPRHRNDHIEQRQTKALAWLRGSSFWCRAPDGRYIEHGGTILGVELRDYFADAGIGS